VTGETTRLNDRAFQICEQTNGLLFAIEYGPGDEQTWPVYRFTSDDPQPRRVMRQPNYFAHDGTQQVYWLGSNQLLGSADGGLTWEQRRLPQGIVSNLLVSPVDSQALYAVATAEQPATAYTIYASADGGRSWQPLVQAHFSEQFSPYLPLTVAATPDGAERLLVLDVSEAGPTQVRPVSPSKVPTSRYFPETRHNLGGAFKRFWEAQGGLAQFGYPKTEPFREVNPADGRIYTVQYFERNRFEYHPEQAGTRYEVLLGLLGNQLLKQQGWE